MYVDNPLVSVVSHFVANLQTIKEVSIAWYIEKKVQGTKELVEIEGLIAESFKKLVLVFPLRLIGFLLLIWSLVEELSY